MIRNIVLDLGGVLITYHPVSSIMRAGYSREDAERLNRSVFLDPLWTELDRGTYASMEEALPLFCSAHPEDEKLIRAFFSNNWMELLFQPIEASVVFLKKLKQHGYRVYFLTNYAADSYQETSSRLSFFSLADGAVVSSEVKINKPDERIYRILLERYSLVPSETLFFDDHEINCKAAIRCGMHAQIFRDAETAEEVLLSNF